MESHLFRTRISTGPTTETIRASPRLDGAVGHGLQPGLSRLWLGSPSQQASPLGGSHPDRSHWGRPAGRFQYVFRHMMM